MNEPEITPELVAQHNLTPEEYAQILQILGRPPTYTELGIFSVMWSEHCSYKNTRPLLKLFPTRSPRVLVGAGEENAGIVDIGDGLAVAFKVESHNHPSAVEPFQGAATGVGGIIRDIFTMGARPICAVNSLRFGPLTEEAARDAAAANNRRLFAGVVSGIAHYGNCFGIPTLAGEVYFDRSYEGNPLVNVFCLGVLRHEQIARARAQGIGNPVFYVGPPTGRDGLAGAAFASQDLTEESAELQRGAVQVGDPFMEKLVCEACLELLATGAVAGIQDMGAAGLTCSTCETAARAGTGIEIDLDKVPQRVPNLSSYEIMLSESQERMLVIVHKGREEEVRRIFEKWELPWAEIGVVTDTGRMVVKHQGRVVADIPAAKIANESPVYHRQGRPPAWLAEAHAFRLEQLPQPDDVSAALRKLLAWPSIASKNWVYRQYDHMVRNNTVVCPGSDAAVLRIKPDCLPPAPAHVPERPVPEKYLAVSADGNAAYVLLDPYEGGKAVVVEAARNLACSGAVPIGVTDNLNFGNPLHPDLFWQLSESVRGMAEACRALQVPVTGGNCSLYNQSPRGPIDPTPTVVMVGLIEEAAHITTQWFKDEGDVILLLGQPVDLEDPLQGMGGSAWMQIALGRKTGRPPRCCLSTASTLHSALVGLIRAGGIKSAHDCSEGGLAVCLAESCISQQIARHTPRLIGADVDLTPLLESNASQVRPRLDALLFGETQSRVVVTCAPLEEAKITERARLLGVPVTRLGRVGGSELVLRAGASAWRWPVAELHDLWWNSLARLMG
ncbi:phosphoribosylformylglycinamidine synthase subunit PurL [Limisphaera sp. VF-2]|jgi:phosphoribosylformylglycinamidine synthase II|uniref:phosphoribosylformylglycinamidine synthase subunit PurL n=1 Tax=Limisphaera sp. VF-2 TaxID=3400418 RepID=UPI00176272B8